MESIRYVNEQGKQLVERIEKKLADAGERMGILFVSIEAVPKVGGNVSEINVRVGMDKSLSAIAGNMLIRTLLNEEIAGGVTVNASVYLGISATRKELTDA